MKVDVEGRSQVEILSTQGDISSYVLEYSINCNKIAYTSHAYVVTEILI